MKRTTLTLLLFLAGISLFAQEIQISSVKLHNGEVEVHYNLLDERIDRSYSVNLFTSKDNFIQPMDNVRGDIGIDIPVGENKIVVWNAKEELGSTYDGALSIELKGNYYVPFILIDGLYQGMEFKRGKSNDLVWSGGRGDNILNFELYRGENLVKVFDERPNTGNTSIVIPKKIKPGDNYRYKISDTRNRDEVVFTETFQVKRKYPLGLQIGAAAIIGFGLGYLVKTLIPEEERIINEPPLPAR